MPTAPDPGEGAPAALDLGEPAPEAPYPGERTPAAPYPRRPPLAAPAPHPTAARRRGWLEVRWRQFRRAPTPVVRAVVASGGVAGVLGLGYLAYDLAIARGAVLPGGDLRTAAGVLFVLAVAGLGAWITYLIVPQPGRPGTRSRWSAALGLFAALPIAYLALVVLFQVLKPLLTGA